jgi:hypothetical protein
VLLDNVVPRWHKAEFHRVRLTAEPAAVWAAVFELTWSEVPVFRALLRLRTLNRSRLSSDARIVDTFRAAGFLELGRTPDELVFGMVARAGGAPITIGDTAGFVRFDTPGYVKTAMNFRYVNGILGTRTRVFATDAQARRRFAGYWFLIRPFSGLIRRIWLRAIRRRCLRAASAPAL